MKNRFLRIISSMVLDKRYRIHLIMSSGICNFLRDEEYLRITFERLLNKKLNLNNPKTFNEKIQWLKLYDRKPEYTTMVDKYAVKKYVASIIGEEYIIPTLGVWNHFDEINFEKLPKQFVLKCTHDSGGLVICKDKNKLNLRAAKKTIEKCLRRNYYWYGREWPYKNVKPRIIAEKYMSDEGKEELSDYKVLCFNGEPKIIEVHKGRFYGNHTADNYDEFWNKTDIEQYDLPKSDEIMPKPAFLEEMLHLSKLLSKNLIHVRVDWYFTNNRLYFGELTFFDGSGYNLFCGDADELLGSWIKLPK